MKHQRRYIKSVLSDYEILKASDVMKVYGTDHISIQQRCRPGKDLQWNDVKEPLWNWYQLEYRIKP